MATQFRNRRPDGSKPLTIDSVRPDTVLGHPNDQNIAKEFVRPGKEILELLMRTVLEDINEANWVAEAIEWCEEFCPKKVALVQRILALRTSIKGRARLELLQYGTGIVAPSLMGVKSGNDGRDGKQESKII